VVLLCPVAELYYDGESTCKVFPYKLFFRGASTMSPYTKGDFVCATNLRNYTAEDGGVFLAGDFDFGPEYNGLKGSFSAQIYSDYSLVLFLNYSWIEGKASKLAKNQWYGTVDPKSISPNQAKAGRKFRASIMMGKLRGGVAAEAVGAVKVQDIGAGWMFSYPLAGVSTGLGIGASAPSSSSFAYSQMPGNTSAPNWSGCVFGFVQAATSSPIYYTPSAAGAGCLWVRITSSIVLQFEFITPKGVQWSLGLAASLGDAGVGKLGTQFDGGPYLYGTGDSNPMWLQV